VKRVLLVTYYFPPSGGPGVQRGLKFARYLPAFGWQPTILTVRPENAAYSDLDPTLEAEVPAMLPVERTKAWDPYAFYARLTGRKKDEAVGVAFVGEEGTRARERLARWVRANVFLPDARVGWVPFARRRAEKLVKTGAFDAVLTTGPPHSTHLIGRALARRHSLPWIADFRDPWTDISYYHELPFTPAARRRDAALERSVLEEADRVVAVSPSLKALLARKTETAVEVISNGFDEADFVAVHPHESEGFVLAHTGTLSASQNPDALWRALRRLRDAGTIPALRIRLVGHVDGQVLRDLARHELEDLLEKIPYVPHDEAIRYMCGASLLLLSINRVPDASLIVTGKLFEYLASGRPVVGVGPDCGDAAAILQETGAGHLFEYDDAAGIMAYVKQHYEAWAAGTPLAGAAPGAADAYNRKHQAGVLAGVLEAVRRKRPGEHPSGGRPQEG